MDITDVYIAEHNAEGFGTSMQRRIDYAPHFYRFCDKRGDGFVMIKETLLKKLIGKVEFAELQAKLEVY